MAEGRAAVHLRGDERHQRSVPGDGPEDGRQPGHHLPEALAEGTARVQEDLQKHPQAAVLKESLITHEGKVHFLSFLKKIRSSLNSGVFINRLVMTSTPLPSGTFINVQYQRFAP